MITRLNHPSLRLVGAIVAFIIVLVLSRAVLPVLITKTLRDIVIWIPVIPAGFIAFSLVIMVRQMDEFQRKVQVDAASFALIGTLMILVVLSIVDETPRSLIVFLLVLTLWLLGWIVSRRRYT